MTENLDTALAGTRVVEVGGLAAAFCGFVLRSYGADVLRIDTEASRRLRERSPQIDRGDGTTASAAYLAYNRGKSVVTEDGPVEQANAEIVEAAATADVLVLESDSGAVGLDIEALQAANPRLIVTVISPFGLTGPGAGWIGSDLIASAMSGMASLTGVPGESPLRMGAEQATKIGGAEAAAGTMTALFARDSSGRGQVVDVAMRDATIRATVNALPKFEYEGVVQERVGDHWGVRDKPLRAVWTCTDGWVAFVRRGGAMGARVNPECVAWMKEHGIDVSELETVDWGGMDLGNPVHREKIDILDLAFEQFLAKQTVEYAFREGLRRGMTIAPIRRISEILDDDHPRERLFWDELVLGDKSYRLPGRFVRTGDQDPQRLPAPTLVERSRAHG